MQPIDETNHRIWSNWPAGRPIARALLQNAFEVMAVTRNTESEKAKSLRDAGAEVIAGRVSDPDSVKAVISSAYGVYVVTLVSQRS